MNIRLRFFATLGLILLASCLQESGGGLPVNVCDPAVSDCTLCEKDGDCHTGTALGFSEHGWRCVDKHCAKSNCQKDDDCQCSKSKFSRGLCEKGDCFCTQCTKSSQCSSGQSCDENRCTCGQTSDCYSSCNTTPTCGTDKRCLCASQ